MTRFGKAAAMAGLLLGLAAAGVALTMDRGPAGAPPSATPDAKEQPSIVDRASRPEPELTLPAAFHGTWASTLADCGGAGWVRIEAGGFRAPDSVAVLREPVAIVRETTPGGVAAATIVARVEQMSEGETGTGRVRMSRAGEHLYMSNADAVGEAEHWQLRNVRCPEPAQDETPADSPN